MKAKRQSKLHLGSSELVKAGLLKQVVNALTRTTETDTPQSRQAKHLLREGRLAELSQLTHAPSDFQTYTEYFEYVQVRDILRKLEIDNPDGQEAAEESFLACEAQCFESNWFLSRLSDNSAYRGLLEEASRLCSEVLGKVPNELRGRHGPGAVFNTVRNQTTGADKMQEVPTRTRDADIFLYHWRETAWGRGNSARRLPEPSVVRGNRFTTVPKDLTKRRGICIEPSLNVFYQLAVGRHIRGRLKLVAGIDLEGGQMVHRQRAAEATLRDEATLDLSNASDTLCEELVKILIPSEWYELLSSLRSSHTLFKGAWYRLEKFSSMGNGFTFELETLCFWALIRATLGPSATVLVYGDDIIVPSAGFPAVVEVLKLSGFTPNPKKSFSEGPFRESCGGDYFWGVDVRPHFQKRLPHEPESIISLSNGLYRSLRKLPCDHPFRRSLALARVRCLEALPVAIRSCIGPEALGDIVIHDDNWEHPQHSRVVNSIRMFRCWKPAGARHKPWKCYDPEVVLACALLGVGDGARGVTPRASITGFKLGWASYS